MTSVELVLINGESVGFDRRLGDGDRVAVSPMLEAFDVTPLLRVREHALREPRFVADAHLGGLAHQLRLFGFDTLYDNHFEDAEIVRLTVEQGRIMLTRDRELLKRLTHGCYVRALHRDQQLRDVFDRLDLAGSARPFTRCLRCNAPLRAIDKADVVERLPTGVRERHERFACCEGCGRVFWEGTHWRRMRTTVDALLARLGDAGEPAAAPCTQAHSAGAGNGVYSTAQIAGSHIRAAAGE